MLFILTMSTMKSWNRLPKITEYVWSINNSNTVELDKKHFIEKLLTNTHTNWIIDKNKTIARHAMTDFFESLLKYEIDTLLDAHNSRANYNKRYEHKAQTQKSLSENLHNQQSIKQELVQINEHMKQELQTIKALIKSSSLYNEVIVPYESILNNNPRDQEIKTLYQIDYFHELYTLLGTLAHENNTNDKKMIQKILTLRQFIQWKRTNKTKQWSPISIFNKASLSNNDIEKYYDTLDVEEIKVKKPMRKITKWAWWKRDIQESKEPFKKSEAFIHLLRRLGVEEQHLYWKKIIIIFWNDFMYHATFFSFYLDELNGAKIDKTIFLFNPDVTSGEPNRSTYIFTWKVALEKLYEIEWSLKDFLTNQLNATVIKQTQDKQWWEKRVTDTLFEPRPEALMKDTKILTKIYYYSRDYFTHFQEWHEEITWKTKKEIAKIMDQNYSGIMGNDQQEQYNMNFQRLANASTYSQEAHKINKFIREAWRNCWYLSMDYIWFRNLLLGNADKEVHLTLHNDNIERYLIAWLHPCNDESLLALLRNETNNPKIAILLASLKEQSKNPYLFKQRVTQFNRDEELVEKYWFLHESLPSFKKQYERVRWKSL